MPKPTIKELEAKVGKLQEEKEEIDAQLTLLNCKKIWLKSLEEMAIEKSIKIKSEVKK